MKTPSLPSPDSLAFALALRKLATATDSERFAYAREAMRQERTANGQTYLARKAYAFATRAQDGQARAVYYTEYRALRRIYSTPSPEDDMGLNGGG